MKQDLEQLFLHIITKGKKDNTYKFALGKFLLEVAFHATDTKKIKISYDDIAEAFLKYYWFQECKYKIKQDFKQNSQPQVISIIQKYCGTEYIADSFDKYFKKHDFKNDIIQEIKQKCLYDVIPRFQPDESNLFYKHFHERSSKKYKIPNQENRYIILNEKTVSYFKSNYELFHKVLILEWAKFLEKTNFTPKLIAKIENLGKTKRNSLLKHKKMLLSIDKSNKCFYCGCNLDSNIHVDHFIPWSYVYADEIWNLVLSCSSCNLKKSDYLPSKDCLEKIKLRNFKYNFLQVNKDIDEYYHNCKKSGFLEYSSNCKPIITIV